MLVAERRVHRRPGTVASGTGGTAAARSTSPLADAARRRSDASTFARRPWSPAAGRDHGCSPARPARPGQPARLAATSPTVRRGSPGRRCAGARGRHGCGRAGRRRRRRRHGRRRGRPDPALWTLDGDALGDRRTRRRRRGRRDGADDGGARLRSTPARPRRRGRAGSSWTATGCRRGRSGGVAVRRCGRGLGSTTCRRHGGDVRARHDVAARTRRGVRRAARGAAARRAASRLRDGSTWTRWWRSTTRATCPRRRECGTIAVDDEGGVWLTGDRRAAQPVVVPRPRRRRRPPRRAGASAGHASSPGRASSPPRAAPLVAALAQPGGVPVQRVVRSPDDRPRARRGDARDDGCAAGHRFRSAVVPFDDRGAVVGMLTSPLVLDDADGSYRWTTARRSAGRRAAASARDAAPHRRAPTATSVGSSPRRTADVALATVPDPSPTPDAGSIGDVVARDAPTTAGRRGAGARWRRSPGRERGRRRRRQRRGRRRAVEPSTPRRRRAAGAAGARRRRLDVRAGRRRRRRRGVAHRGVPAPDGSVLAFGARRCGGRPSRSSVDPVAGRASMRPGPPGSAPVGCASTNDTIFVASAGTVMSTVDVERYDPLDVLRPGEAVTAIAVGPGAVAVTGTTPLGDALRAAARPHRAGGPARCSGPRRGRRPPADGRGRRRRRRRRARPGRRGADGVAGRSIDGGTGSAAVTSDDHEVARPPSSPRCVTVCSLAACGSDDDDDAGTVAPVTTDGADATTLADEREPIELRAHGVEHAGLRCPGDPAAGRQRGRAGHRGPARRSGAAPADVEVVSDEEVTWRDSSAGCSQKGMQLPPGHHRREADRGGRRTRVASSTTRAATANCSSAPTRSRPSAAIPGARRPPGAAAGCSARR